MKKVKYKEGQLVYSYQNPTEKRPINRVRISEEDNFEHTYRLTFVGDDGFPKNSHWINESSLSLKPIKK
jgi:hypothetical protein